MSESAFIATENDKSILLERLNDGKLRVTLIGKKGARKASVIVDEFVLLETIVELIT